MKTQLCYYCIEQMHAQFTQHFEHILKKELSLHSKICTWVSSISQSTVEAGVTFNVFL